MNVRILFEKRNAWVGVYWAKVVPPPDPYDPQYQQPATWQVYVCLLPFFPILIEWIA